MLSRCGGLPISGSTTTNGVVDDLAGKWEVPTCPAPLDQHFDILAPPPLQDDEASLILRRWLSCREPTVRG